MADPREASRKLVPQPLTEAELDRNAKLIARVIYRDLRSKGFSHRQIVAISAELVSLVLAEMQAAT
ncbi:hypothetical protein HY634_00630 [Candidatus Uhrbacteria bacterium]|nr:hypothetical protein [Candidatus Uhrbacteria bacterium]